MEQLKALLEKGYHIGAFVRYTCKNELGLIGLIQKDFARCWFHMGGTRSGAPYDIIEPLALEEVLKEKFENEYAKASLIERFYRLHEGGDVTDLIDRDDIRQSVHDLLENERSL